MAESDPAKSAALVASIRRFLHGFSGWIKQTPIGAWSYYRWEDMAMTIFWMLDNHPVIFPQLPALFSRKCEKNEEIATDFLEFLLKSQDIVGI